MSGRARPLRFVALMLALWIGGRLAVVAPWQDGASGNVAKTRFVRRVASAAPARVATSPYVIPAKAGIHGRRPLSAPAVPYPWAPAFAGVTAGKMRAEDTAPEAAEQVASASPRWSDPSPDAGAVALAPASPSRWSGSGWLLVRGAGGSGFAPGGQLGGSQTGARIAWRIDEAGRLALAGRVSRPLRQTGLEAAAAIDWRPFVRLPLRLIAERRVALERGARDAFAVYAVGGADAVAVRGLRLDAYGQAGLVGLRSRDLFADGAARLGREMPLARKVGLTLGAGAWGGAQPGAARLDAGPQAALRFPLGNAGFVLAIDWRLRVAGHARPGSGPTLTLGADF